MSNVWVMSDLHFGHKNILKYRDQFSSIEEHDETIMENIFMSCKKRDTLWLLGDCFFTKESLSFLRRMQYISQINFVIGNHDTDSSDRIENIHQMLREGLVNKIGSLFKKNKMWLSHHPIHPAELRGLRNVHGHVHNATIPDDRYFNACLENIEYKPKLLGEC